MGKGGGAGTHQPSRWDPCFSSLVVWQDTSQEQGREGQREDLLWLTVLGRYGLAMGVAMPTQPGLLTPQQIRKQKAYWTEGKAEPSRSSFQQSTFC